MHQLQTFNFDSHEVRTQNINDEPWFVGRDVTEILGYSNSRKALFDHVDDEDKGVTKWDTLGGRQDLTIINESGLYSLIFKSKMPNSRRFKRWVTSEVLPTIRKTGGYQVSNTKLLLKASLEHEEKLEELTEDVGFLKETMRIDGTQEFQIKAAGNKKVISCLGGYDSPAYKELAKKIYTRFWRDFKQYFVIPRYGELPRSKFSEAMEFIDEWSPDTEMRMKIKLLNNQTHLQLVNEKGD